MQSGLTDSSTIELQMVPAVRYYYSKNENSAKNSPKVAQNAPNSPKQKSINSIELDRPERTKSADNGQPQKPTYKIRARRYLTIFDFVFQT
jgi:hypothetical protein